MRRRRTNSNKTLRKRKGKEKKTGVVFSSEEDAAAKQGHVDTAERHSFATADEVEDDEDEDDNVEDEDDDADPRSSEAKNHSSDSSSTASSADEDSELLKTPKDHTTTSPQTPTAPTKLKLRSRTHSEAGLEPDDASLTTQQHDDSVLRLLFNGPDSLYCQMLIVSIVVVCAVSPLTSPSVWDEGLRSTHNDQVPRWVTMVWAMQDQVHWAGAAASCSFAAMMTMTYATIVLVFDRFLSMKKIVSRKEHDEQETFPIVSACVVFCFVLGWLVTGATSPLMIPNENQVVLHPNLVARLRDVDHSACSSHNY